MFNVKKNKVYIIIAALAVIALFFIFYKPSDIDFCRTTFSGLMKGDYSVAKNIDWENFKALGTEVGKTYTGLPNDKERAKYRDAFIKSSAKGFQYAKGSINNFINWRVYSQDGEEKVIACDYPLHNKVLLFTLSKFGGRKIIVINWEATK